MKPGQKTTEFWGKVIVQVVLLVNLFLPAAHQLPIDDALAIKIIAGLEMVYGFVRGIVKHGAAA